MDQSKSTSAAKTTNNTVQKQGNTKQVNSAVTVVKPTVENKQQKTALDTASKKVEDALTKKWQALKKENDRMEQQLKSHKKDSLHTDSIKRGLIKVALEQKEKTPGPGISK